MLVGVKIMAVDDGKKPTIYDVAQASGVSIGTVSRVLNNRRNVAKATRERVLETARRLGFMPQHTTRRVSIGLVVQDIEEIHETAYMGRVLCQLANHASRRGVVLEIMHLGDIERAYEHYLQGLIGVVFGKATARLDAVRDVPVVLINNVPGKGRFHTVATDHADGARMGTAYLLERGHRRIALVQTEKNEWGSRERERGYREAFKAAGARPPEDLVACLEGRSVEKVFDPLLQRAPTAVFVGGEDLSLAVTNALVNRLRVRIPDELSLMTYEVPVTSWLSAPPLTTIAQPWAQLARTALDTLLAAVRKKTSTPQHVVLPNTLIERASVRELRGGGAKG